MRLLETYFSSLRTIQKIEFPSVISDNFHLSLRAQRGNLKRDEIAAVALLLRNDRRGRLGKQRVYLEAVQKIEISSLINGLVWAGCAVPIRNHLPSCFFKFILIVLIFSGQILEAQEAYNDLRGPLTLKDCYNLTLKRSESLKIKDSEVEIADQQYKIALSALYPNINLGFEHRRRDNANFGRVSRGSRPLDDPSTPIGGTGGILGKTQAGAVISLSQPIFYGFRNFLLSDAAKVETEAQRLEASRSRELIYLDVSDIYYQIVFTQDDLKVLEQSKKTFKARVSELKDFINLGKSRESEVFAAESDLADLEASMELASGLKKTSKELLAFLTGVQVHELRLSPDKKIPALKQLEEYLSISSMRKDFLASKQRVEAQEKRVTAAERERWPTIDLLGNGYALQDPDRNQEWDMTFQFSVPLFEGGRIAARTAQEEARLRIAELNKSDKSRSIERDIRVAYTRVLTSQGELSSLKKLRQAANKNYELQKQDYKNGVVTNLEVLQAIRQVQEAERKLVRAEQSYYANFSELNIAAGGVPE